MKKLIDPSIDVISDRLQLTTLSAATQDVRLYGLNRNGTINIIWSGAGGNLNLDIEAAALDVESPPRFQSILSAAITNDEIVQVINLCTGWIRFNTTGTVWGADTLDIEYTLKTVESV